MKILTALILALTLPLTPFAQAAGESDVDKESQIIRSVECAVGSETRRLKAVTHFAGCRLHYTKGGKSNQVAQSQRGVDICLENLAKIQKNLEAAGHHCK